LARIEHQAVRRQRGNAPLQLVLRQTLQRDQLHISRQRLQVVVQALPVVQVGHGVTLVPVLFFNQDLTGFSPDGAIVGGRLSLGAYLRVLLRQKYYIEAGNVIYDRGAEWDPIADRGQYTLTLGINL